ncbi:MAG TPA: UDP-3-O-(3-hydroxymyristoyl)glucosamine N-acyltransferase [Phycisphaerales bacterium]|nr:UDP-3-O-(3-hydroxymyristoyl)glucosamine N-acyltransferase [Phycisphaerales bacterium]
MIEAVASVGDGTILRANVFIGAGASVGRMCHMQANVAILDRCTVGDGCNFFPGVVIGADGFGYRPSPDGRGVVKIPHTGIVEIGAGVEIGANTCIDRAKFGATVVGAGSKFDNLVQIGHGVRIGRSCLFAAGTAVGGSCTFGDGVMVGGQAGFADSRHMGPGCRVGAQSGVMDNVPAGESWLGTPAMPAHYTLRSWAETRRIGSSRAKRSNAKKEKKPEENKG